MGLLQLLAWIASELFIARAAAESSAEPLRILHAGEIDPPQPKEIWPFGSGNATPAGETVHSPGRESRVETVDLEQESRTGRHG